ncbi:MAG: TonB-dependent receptor [Marinilabiliales bacterium]|nr:MAG: TonB-dependent receptor [Marinilabiliales bacterium]
MKRIGIIIFLITTTQFAISQTITGLVKNEQGEALIGANILIKETFKGTATNINGEFIFTKIKPDNYTFKVSFLGYKTLEQEVHKENLKNIEFTLEPSSILSEEVIVTATRAKDNDPISFTNISNSEIKESNFGQDIPYLLSSTPSVVSTSDAGTGIGYTYFRIRVTDLNRINITVNGIPLNDAEDHGVWFVNMPDFLSSVENIQIQRGVGTSSNGAASFGATLNLQTKTFNKDAYAEINSFSGSFNTFRNSVSFGTGLINDKFTFDGRLSKITSDGFIDRADSDLESFYLSGAYYTGKSILKANIISGKEKTYQAWYGIPKVRLEDDNEGMQRYLDHWLIDQEEYDHMINSNSRTYNFYTYDNETDNYKQDHYQLFYSYEFNPALHLNTALHYTRGKGYYEQYKKDRDFADYQLDDLIIGTETISSTDLIQQKWLDNHFYGGVFSLEYKLDKLNLTLGGGWNQFLGDHFGEVVWSQYASNGDMKHRWYENDGNKTDFNIYTKLNYALLNKLKTFIDLQYRYIDYSIDGIDDDLRNITQNHIFNFFNPKIGLFYEISDLHSSYLTLGIANREPNRSNYTDADPSKPLPTAETLYNLELGYELSATTMYLSSNLYYMYYIDQLVLTGEINDVGAAILTNVDKSYRLGFELSGGIQPTKKLHISANATISKNKILNFTEYIDNWDTGIQAENNLGETDLSFSPNIIANGKISYDLFKDFKAELISKYVGKQYIDNTSNNDRSIDPYFVNDVKFAYKFETKLIKEIGISLLINNLFNHEYESNAWVYRYILGSEEYLMDGYFPQAGISFVGGLTLKF